MACPIRVAAQCTPRRGALAFRFKRCKKRRTARRVPKEDQYRIQSVERAPVDAVTAIPRVAGSSPESVALSPPGADKLTHEALRLGSDAPARTRREQRGHGALVGYYAERDLDPAMAAVAILKAGSTYLPVGQSPPACRTSFMIEQSRRALFICRDRPGRHSACAR